MIKWVKSIPMSETFHSKEQAHCTSIPKQINHILFCVTCGQMLGMFDDQHLNFVLDTVAQMQADGHIKAYSSPHVVELIDIKGKTSTQYPPSGGWQGQYRQ